MREAFNIALIAAAGSGAGDLIETHSMSLGTAVAVATIVLPAAWWLSRRFTKLDDRIDVLSAKIDALPCPGKKECEPK